MYYQQPIQMTASNFHPYILEVTGEGEISVTPNLAFVNLGVMNEGKDLVAAQQQNSVAINRVIQNLLTLGIPRNSIQTFDYRIDSQYDFDHGKQLFRGYKVTHLLRVKMEELSSVGKIIDMSVHEGANYVANVQYSAAHIEAYYLKSLSEAIIDAQQKAKSIAATLKVTLHPTPLSIIEGSKTESSITLQAFPVVKGITSTSFEPGQLLIKAKITAFFRYNS
jgi:uncharacterized protein YggE